jgi:predicted transcriptional regulator
LFIYLKIQRRLEISSPRAAREAGQLYFGMASAKEEIRRMIETLPDNVTWEEVQYSIYVRERIERGRREAAEGEILDEDEAVAHRVAWTDSAWQELEAAAGFIARDSPRFAAALMDSARFAARSLRRFPERGMLRCRTPVNCSVRPG